MYLFAVSIIVEDMLEIKERKYIAKFITGFYAESFGNLMFINHPFQHWPDSEFTLLAGFYVS